MLGTVMNQATPDAETTTGLTAIFMYFVGKVDARRPAFDYGTALIALMNAPGYDRQLPVDLKRCGAEAESRGAMLKELGETMQRVAPLAPAARPG